MLLPMRWFIKKPFQKWKVSRDGAAFEVFAENSGRERTVETGERLKSVGQVSLSYAPLALRPGTWHHCQIIGRPFDATYITSC